MPYNSPVVLTGATGFIGSAVRHLAPPDQELTLLSRTPPAGELASHETHRVADITKPHEIERAIAGAGSIIHCASYVRSDTGLAWQVNDQGTRHVVDAAALHGVKQITYVSTTGVYGRGEMQGADETHPTDPASETSRSRLAAERHVIEAGGTVIRPHLVYGHGDRWVLPLLLRFARTYGLPDAGRARASFIRDRELAAQIWALHDLEEPAPTARVINAHHGPPVTLADVWHECHTKLRLTDHPNKHSAAGCETGLSARQRDMLSTDNWFTSRLQSLGIQAPTTPFSLDEAMVEWYQRQLYSPPSRTSK